MTAIMTRIAFRLRLGYIVVVLYEIATMHMSQGREGANKVVEHGNMVRNEFVQLVLYFCLTPSSFPHR